MTPQIIDQMRRQSPQAFNALTNILYQEDPLAINFGFNPEEYETEAAGIMAKLPECHSLVALHGSVHSVFVAALGGEMAGERQRYEKIAQRIWNELPNWSDYPPSIAVPPKPWRFPFTMTKGLSKTLR